MDHRLVLDYSLTAGRLEPWIAALRHGKATGLSCSDCGKVSFPPVRRCTCGSTQSKWVELVGTASIVERSDGDGSSFALAKFDGADTVATVRLQDPENNTDHRCLAAVPDGPPALVLVPDSKDKSS